MNNKKTTIIIISIIIGLVLFVSLIIFNRPVNNSENVINIDDCTGKDCNKNNTNKNDKDDNNNTNNTNNSSNNSNGSSSSGTSGGTSGTGTGTGSGSGSGNGTGSGSGGSGGSGEGSGSGSSSDSGTGPSSGTTPSEEPAVDIEVKDNNITWNESSSLKIFDVDEIKPGDSGSYEFSVKNNSDGNIVYNVNFTEKNQYTVNMLYKLKMNGNYVSGDSDTWITFNELNLKNKVLESEYMDLFNLEWKWIDSDHDTVAGVAKNAKYSLSVNVSSKETSEHDSSGSGSVNPNTGDKIMFYVEVLLGAAIAFLVIILIKRKKNEDN